MTLNFELDAHDTRILAELQADARLTMAELGRRVHLSQPAVTERVRKLEAAGVVTGYRATVDLGRGGPAAAEVVLAHRLVRAGRTLIFHIVRARSPMPKPVRGP